MEYECQCERRVREEMGVFPERGELVRNREVKCQGGWVREGECEWVVLSAVGNAWAPDLVGFEVLE